MSSSGPLLVTMSRSNGSHIYIYSPGTEVWWAGGWQVSHSRHWYNSPNDTSLSSMSPSEKLRKNSETQWNFRYLSWSLGQYHVLINIGHSKSENKNYTLKIFICLLLRVSEETRLIKNYLPSHPHSRCDACPMWTLRSRDSLNIYSRGMHNSI